MCFDLRCHIIYNVFCIAKLGLFRNIERDPALQTADISPKQLQQAGEYTNQFKEEIEMGLDVGIRNGVPANKMTRDLKQYLRHPDKLFRRVRDEHGQLQLSKAAKAYHPGRGVYRSSYKNARRLTATETNMAYRTADYERWQQLDFVVGIKIEPSVNNHETDICDDLAGKYPKDFKWTGWHPHCRCHALTILKTEKELDADTERILNGEEPSQESVNKVEAMPENFSKWIEKNQERIEKAKTLPDWIKDRKKVVDEIIEAAKEDKQSAHQYVIQKVYKSGGSVKIMNEYDTTKNDYKSIRTIAHHFAQRGKEVHIPHPLHIKSQEYSQVFGDLIGTKYEGKCPGLIIDGKFYEFEGFVKPWKKKKVGRMISHGLAQSSRIIIDNNKGGSDRLIRKAIMARLNLPNQDIREVWIYEKGKPRLFYKDGKFCTKKKQQEG